MIFISKAFETLPANYFVYISELIIQTLLVAQWVNQLRDQLSFSLDLSIIDRALSCRCWRVFNFDLGRLPQITLAFLRWLSITAQYTSVAAGR